MASIQDRQKTTTIEQLRRRYDLDGLNKDRKAIQMVKNTINRTESELSEFVNLIKENAQEFNQAEVTAWFFSGMPTLENYPCNIWEDASVHLGDYYYDRETGQAYRFVKEESCFWKIVDNLSTTQALAIANSSADVSDNFRQTFLSMPSPPYYIGDIWVKSETEFYRCRAIREGDEFNSLDWIKSVEYNDSLVALQTKAELNQFKNDVSENYTTNATFETTINSITGRVEETYTQITTVENEVGEISSKVDTTVNKMAELEITTDKITTEVSKKIDEQDAQISQVTQSVNEIKSEISEVADITISADGYGNVSLANINKSEPIYLKIYPTNGEDISYLYPRDNLYPSDDLFSTGRTLRFSTTEYSVEYELPNDLLYYDEENYDEFILDYDAQSCVVNKKVGYNADGSKYILESPQTIEYEYPIIDLEVGDYTIEMLNYSNAFLFARLMVQNIYTDQFATKMEMNSAITQTANSIKTEVSEKYATQNQVNSSINQMASSITSNVSKTYATKGELTNAQTTIKQTTDNISSEVSKKVGDNEIISKINQSLEEITILAKKLGLTANDVLNIIAGNEINLTSKNITIKADKFSVDKNGNLVCENAKISGQITGSKISGSEIFITSKNDLRNAEFSISTADRSYQIDVIPKEIRMMSPDAITEISNERIMTQKDYQHLPDYYLDKTGIAVNNIDSDICAINSNGYTYIPFNRKFSVKPNVVMTAITETNGVIAAKVRNITTEGFEATIGGTTFNNELFSWIAIANIQNLETEE